MCSNIMYNKCEVTQYEQYRKDDMNDEIERRIDDERLFNSSTGSGTARYK